MLTPLNLALDKQKLFKLDKACTEDGWLSRAGTQMSLSAFLEKVLMPHGLNELDYEQACQIPEQQQPVSVPKLPPQGQPSTNDSAQGL